MIDDQAMSFEGYPLMYVFQVLFSLHVWSAALQDADGVGS
jgi:hypothetical protein